MTREMVYCANGFLSHRNLSHLRDLWAYDSAFDPRDPFLFISWCAQLTVELDCRAHVFGDLSPFLHTLHGETGVFRCIFAYTAVKAASHNSHYLSYSGSNGLLKASPHDSLNQRFSNWMHVGFGEPELGRGFFSPWQSARLFTFLCVRVKMHILSIPPPERLKQWNFCFRSGSSDYLDNRRQARCCGK